MLKPEELGIAIEDVRLRQQGLIDLILFVDQQAMALLNLYVTAGIATVGGFLASLGPAPLVPSAAGAGLLGAAITLTTGASFCVAAMAKANVALVGETPEFWLWASHPKVGDLTKIADEYFARIGDSMMRNRKQNSISAGRLTIAKLLGLAAPFAAIVFGAADIVAQKIT